MIPNLPPWIEILFLLTWALTIGMFYVSNGKPKMLTLVIIGWCVLHAVLAYSGFYQNTEAMPPRFGLVLIPNAVAIIWGVTGKRLRWVLENRNLQQSTFLHSVRILVEIVLLYLFYHEMVPELMTFEGRNFDILAGISAPIVGWLFLSGRLSKRGLLIWNVIGLCLVSFILVNGVLSVETPFQQFAFDQPNRALAYFPFILLPAAIVPIVIFTHITDIIKIRREMRHNSSSY